MARPNSGATPTPGSLPTAAIELHCHILPSWDDGPVSLADSLTMAREAVAAGVRTIVATPHIGRAFNGVERAARDIPDAIKQLQGEFTAAGIELGLLPGGEILMGSLEVLERIRDEPWLTVAGAGRYALVESPFRTWPDWGDNLLYELQLRGVTPIVAHPERYTNVVQDINVMDHAVNGGALLQITAGALVGEHGREVKACATKLLQAGLVSLVASDAHRPGHTWAASVAGELVSVVGEAAARVILEKNPRSVLDSKHAGPPEVDHSMDKPSGWRGWLKPKRRY